MSHRLGPFVLDAPLASGGMSRVWAGHHREQGLAVAIKVLTAERARSPAARAALLAEARAVARIEHPAVVRLLDVGVVEPPEVGLGPPIAPGSPYLVMERAEGTLADELPMSPADGRAALRAVLSALAAAHARGVIHRDVKPGNVLRLGHRLVLADFGVAHRLAGAGAGTPSYMAPEQLDADRGAQGPWTDLYAVGCLAHALVTGRPPFEGADAKALAAAHRYDAPPPLRAEGWPPTLAAWVDRLLAKDPARRFRCAADALAALDGHPGAAWSDDWRAPYSAPPFDVIGAGLSLYRHREVPLAGREDERDAIWQALGEVAEHGDARVVLLAGEPGVGASRLARWAVEAAVERGIAQAVVTRGDEAPARAAARAMGVDGDAEPGALRRALDRALTPAGAGADELDEVARLVTDRVGGEGAARTRAALMVEWLGLWSVERPVVWWVDDAHRAPAALEAVQAALSLDDGAGLPVLFLLTASDDEGDGATVTTTTLASTTHGAARATLAGLIGRRITRPLALEPLPAIEMRALVRELLHLDGAVAAELERRAGGHPGFAVEWVGQRIERGELVAGPRGFRAAPGVALEVPVDQGAVWRRRARALAVDAPTRRALELAAALGPAVDAGCWRRAVGEGAAAIEARLLARDVIRPIDGGWRVVHGPLVEAIAAEAAREGRWAAINREAAAAVGEGGDPALAARLHRLGERPRRAIEPLVDAAADALDEGRHAAALGWLDDRAALIEAHLDGVDPAPDRPARLRLAALRKLYRAEEACALAERLWATPPADPAARYEILSEWASALRRLGRLDDAIERRRGALDAARESGQTGLVARAAAHCARLLTLAGRLDGAPPLIDEALSAADDGYARASARFAAGLYWHHRRVYAPAAEALGEARAHMLSIGDLHGVSDADNTLAEIAHAQGDLEAADRHFASSIRYARLSGTSYAVPQLNQGILALDRDQPARRVASGGSRPRRCCARATGCASTRR